jgi:hypothetical protein
MARQSYIRTRDVPRLIGLWPKDLDPTTVESRAQLVAKLERALRAERRRGLAGHWTYDLARHVQLVQACHEERRLMTETVAAEGGLNPR